MSSAWGVTPSGFVSKGADEITAETNADIQSIIAADIDVSPDQPLGQLIGIISGKVAELWDIAGDCYNATNRPGATGDQLANIGSLTGTAPLGPSPSGVDCALSFSLGGTYASGSLVAYLAATPSVQFANAEAIVVPSQVGGAAISTTNPYVLSNAAGANGPPVLFEAATNGEGPGDALVAAGLGKLAQMTPVAGWVSVVDVAGPTIGTLTELDAAYRARQVEELAEPGSCTLPAIEAHVLAALFTAPLPVVDARVTMYENTTLSTDANGLPGKSFQAVVFDGLIPNTQQNDPIIAQQIWNNKPAGMQSFGNVAAPAKDANGNPQTVYFSRPAELQVYAVINVAIATTAADPTGAILVALVNASQGQPFPLYGTSVTPAGDADTTLLPGQDVVLNAFRAIVQGQVGVKDVPSMFIGLAPNPTGTSNLPVELAQVAVLQPANVIVNVSVFVP